MGLSIWQFLIVAAVIIPIVLLPTIIAVVRNHPHKVAIILINVLLGLLFGVGWVVALVWCFIEPVTNLAPPSKATELEKLGALRDKNVLTQSEFEEQKRSILESRV